MKGIITFLFITILTCLLNGQAYWQQTGGPFGGAVNSFLVNSSGDIYAATTGGVFRSTNNGTDWTPLNTGLNELTVNALAINSNGHIYAATWDGVYKTTNGGNSWNQWVYSISKSFQLQ